MNKKQKIKYQKIALFGTIGILLLGLGVAVNGQENLSFMDRIANKAGEILGINISDRIQGNIDLSVEEESFGGTIAEKWVKVGNRVTYIESGRFEDGNIVLLSVTNPFGGGTATSTTDEDYNDDTHRLATSTVVSVNLDVTGVATSTGIIICGAAADRTSAPSYELFNLTLPTSTMGVFNNNQATTSAGFEAIGAGTAAKILLTHEYSYFNCIATSVPAGGEDWGNDEATGGKGGFTGDSNTFDGYWSVEIQKNLQ